MTYSTLVKTHINTKYPPKDIKRQIVKETSWLDEAKPRLKFRQYCIEHDIISIPKCALCAKPTSIESSRYMSFNKLCSHQCRTRHATSEKERRAKPLEDKEWLTTQRNEYKKSKETIAKELGVGYKLVVQWLETHNLNGVDLSHMTPSLKELVSNKEWFEQQYKNKSLKAMGDEIGVSESQMSVWLNKHEIEAKPSNAYPRKINKRSREEITLYDYITTIYKGKVEHSNRSLLNGLELDIYIPELNIAFEYNGVLWHSNFNPNIDKNYHNNKSKLAKERGVVLYHIWSDDWLGKTNIWKSRIKHILGLSESKVYARKCVVNELVSVSDKNTFLHSNHLQGACKSTFKYGLIHDNELVAVMTFGKSRFNKKYDYELIRYACKGGLSVVGGFSKLLKAFRRNYVGKSIISYADMSYSDGGVYAKNGFVQIAEHSKSFKYVVNGKRVNRMNYTKVNLAKKYGQDFVTGKTESQLCLELKIYKLYDCGSKTFVLTK